MHVQTDVFQNEHSVTDTRMDSRGAKLFDTHMHKGKID